MNCIHLLIRINVQPPPNNYKLNKALEIGRLRMILEKYKEEILKAFEKNCLMFKMIGSEGETPRYFNYGGYEDRVLTFASTQNSKLFFKILISVEDNREVERILNHGNEEIWEWFKRLRTNYLIDNHPTIEPGYPRFNNEIEIEVKEREIKTTLVEMLTENTGTHMLDSGGDKGRMWQRNQEKDFEAEEEVTIEYHDGKYSSLTVSTYHYLKQVLECDEISDRITSLFRMKEWHWVNEVEINEVINDLDLEIEEKSQQWNTYNGEYNVEQVFQGQFFMIYDEPYVFMQIHGGADVRGGYTNVQAFKVIGMLDGNVEVSISKDDNSIDFRHGDIDLYDHKTCDSNSILLEDVEELVKEGEGWEACLVICEETCIY